MIKTAEDWKYTSFVIFICYSRNIRRHSDMCGDLLFADAVENIGLKFQFQVWLSIHEIYPNLNGSKMTFEIGVSIQSFQRRPP